MAEHQSSSPRSRRLLWALQTAFALLLVWIALDGVANMWLGGFFAVAGTAVGAWLTPGEPYPWRPVQTLLFVLFFLRESIRGGVDVAWRAFHPRMPISPTFIEHQVALPAGLPRTTLVAVISLLPGTLSVWLESDGRLVVHALTARAAENIADVERRVASLFALDGAKESR